VKKKQIGRTLILSFDKKLKNLHFQQKVQTCDPDPHSADQAKIIFCAQSKKVWKFP
jgi:hypothetical protein